MPTGRWAMRRGWACVVAVTLGSTSCGGDSESLRDALARLPQDTTRPAEPEEVVVDSLVFAMPGAEALPDSAGFIDSIPAAPIEQDTTPFRLTPGEPADTRPWIPEPRSDSLPLAPEWTTDLRESSGSEARMATLESVRTARNDGFDRVVLEFEAGRTPGYRVEYVDRPVRQCGSGQPVPLRGDAWLRIRLEPAQAHYDRGRPTVENRARSSDLPLLRELRLICDYEGQVEWVLGLASPNPFRVTQLNSPARLLVDVRH